MSVSIVSVPALHSPQWRVLEGGQWLCGRRLLWASSARVRVQPEQTCADVGPAQLVCDLDRTWHVPSASANLSPGAQVRFWGPFYVNDGAIFLAAVELNSDAPYVKAGSVPVSPKPASSIFGSSVSSESVRKSTHTSCVALSPTAHLEQHSALESVTQSS